MSVSAERMERSIARGEIIELVQRERLARDMQQWDELVSCYSPGSEVEISWFKGSGAEFAAASARMMSGALQTFHQMSPTVTRIRGDRALADSGCAIHLLGKIDGIAMNVVAQARIWSRVERIADDWLMASLRVVYVRDVILPVDPSRVPTLDQAKLASYRPSYRFVSFMLASHGMKTRNDLPGTDEPEAVNALRHAEEAWLNGAS